MASVICERCKLDFKYQSNLKRHIERKNKCKIVDNNDNKNINESSLEINNSKDNISYNKIEQIIKNKLSLDEKKELLKYLLDDKITEKSKKIYSCNMCNNTFSNSNNLRRHHRLNRCKLKKTTDEIPNTTTNNTNNTNNTTNNTINNNITNNITNNTINNNYNIININPFGLENIDNITKRDIMFIYHNIKYIPFNVCEFVYINNEENISFFKYNIKDKNITVLTENMTIHNIPEFMFLNKLEKNIFDVSIEIFHKNKNDLTTDELKKCMNNLFKYQDNILKNTLKENKEMTNSIMNSIFRNSKIRNNIELFQNTINNKIELKNTKIKEIKDKIKQRNCSINELYNSPDNNNNDDKNLYKIKEQLSIINNES